MTFYRHPSGWWAKAGRWTLAWDDKATRDKVHGYVPLSVREGWQRRWTWWGFELLHRTGRGPA